MDEKRKQFLNTLSTIIHLREEREKEMEILLREERKKEMEIQLQKEWEKELEIQHREARDLQKTTDTLYGYTSPDPGGGVDWSDSNGGDARNRLKVSHASDTHNTEPSLGDILAWADNDEKSMQILKAEYFEAKEKSMRFRNKNKELDATKEDSPSLQNERMMIQPNLNSIFAKILAKEMHTERCAEETYVNSIDNHITNTKEAKVAAGNSRDKMPDAEQDQELTEDDDNEGADVNNESSMESIAKVNGTNEEDVHTYNDTSVEENVDQMRNKSNDATLNGVENFAVSMKNGSKVTLENPNKFTEPEVERNVVKLLFEGTFLENSKEIIKKFNKSPKPEVNVKEITPQITKISNPNNKVDADRAAVRVNLAFRKLSAAAVAGKKGAGSYKLAATKKKAKKHAKKAKKPAAKKRAHKPKAKKPTKKANKDHRVVCSRLISFPWNPGVSLCWI